MIDNQQQDGPAPKQLRRRVFLGGAAGLSALRLSGANDRIRCGVIGTGNRGAYLIRQFAAQGAEVAAVCDVYEPRLQAGLTAAAPSDARGVYDYRRLLDDKSLDAIVIATPDHLHAQMLAVGVAKANLALLKQNIISEAALGDVDDCFRIYHATVDKKMSDLTTRESDRIKESRAAHCTRRRPSEPLRAF